MKSLEAGNVWSLGLRFVSYLHSLLLPVAGQFSVFI